MENPVAQLKDTLARARTEISKVIIGQQEVVDLALVAIFSNRH